MDFYYGSGSPYAWRVWLALEHKALPYTLHVMSFDKGDLKTPAYRAINPRGRVPAIVDNGFALYESAAILEYLHDAYPGSGGSLLPAGVREAATARRMIREADQYLATAMEVLVEEILFTPQDEWNGDRILKGRDALAEELRRLEASSLADDAAGKPGSAGAVDFTVYPMIALALRMERKKPDLQVRAAIGPKLAAWMKRVEALPYFGKTIPPHWRS